MSMLFALKVHLWVLRIPVIAALAYLLKEKYKNPYFSQNQLVCSYDKN